MYYQCNISSRLQKKYEGYATKLQEDLEEMFPGPVNQEQMRVLSERLFNISIYFSKREEYKLTPNGSAFSHDIWLPQEAGLIFSGKDSGTNTIINKMSSNATAEANATTKLSLYTLPR